MLFSLIVVLFAEASAESSVIEAGIQRVSEALPWGVRGDLRIMHRVNADQKWKKRCSTGMQGQQWPLVAVRVLAIITVANRKLVLLLFLVFFCVQSTLFFK